MRMRVIAGNLGGRLFESPDTNTTHPMGERMRGALFNIIAPDIADKTVLDPFGGTGALSFEAISRGAISSVVLENNRAAQNSIQKNIQALGVHQKVRLIKADCLRWSQKNPDQLFDFILADPPYNDMQLSTINMLIRHLKHNGLMILSYPGRGSAPTVNGVVVVDTRLYGDAALAFYRKAA